MNIKNIGSLIIIGLSSSIALSGCALLQGTQNSKKIEQDVVLPRDREQIVDKKPLQTYTPEDIKKGIVKGDWAIESVNGKTAVGEKAPYLKFSPAEKMVYAYNGCNHLSGPYTYNPADSTLNFADMASTMRLCNVEGLTDYEINVALMNVRKYSWNAKGSDYYLYLYDESGKEVMTLMHQNFDFLNGTWVVNRIGETEVNDPEMKMVIDVDEGKIHGNTGCNLYNGSMEIDMDAPNSISFSAIALTRMACPDPNHETELVVAIEEVSAAKPVSPEEVRLFDSQGKQVLCLTRTTDQ